MQKTAYEMRISDWSSDVCSSDLGAAAAARRGRGAAAGPGQRRQGAAARVPDPALEQRRTRVLPAQRAAAAAAVAARRYQRLALPGGGAGIHRQRADRGVPDRLPDLPRSEEHTSELQSLMRISYAV